MFSSSAPTTTFEPFVDEAILDPEKDPNELRIGLARGRNLQAVDSGLLGSTSDPRVRFVVALKESDKKPAKKEVSVKSRVKQLTLNPVWNEILTMKLKKSKIAAKTLTAYVEDWDEITDADPMGSFEISLTEDQQVVPMQWYSCGTGEIQMTLQWWYNPDVEKFEPFKDKSWDPTKIPRPPNELKLGIFRAKGLIADDGATSDPRVRAKLLPPESGAPQQTDFEQEVTTESRTKTLRPLWKQVIVLDAHPPTEAKSPADFPVVELVVEDVDTFGDPTPLGKVTVPLSKLANNDVLGVKWYAMETGALELCAHWWYNRDKDPHADEPHKNENIFSYLVPDFIEDAIEEVVQAGERTFYDIMNTMVLIADLYELSQEWKQCVDSISVVVGLVPTVNNAISEAEEIASLFIKILASATGNPAAILNLLYTGYKSLENSKHLFKLYDESGRFVAAMLSIEHFVIVVMDAIKRGYKFYQCHFAKMDKVERKDARALAKKKGHAFDFEPEWASRDDLYDGVKPNVIYVGLSRARDLVAKDKYVIMEGGTSDPFINFKLYAGDSTLEKTSQTCLRTVKPQWNEDFEFEVVPPDDQDILLKTLFGDDDDDDPDAVNDPDKKKDVVIPDLRPPKEEDEKFDYHDRVGNPPTRQAPKEVAAKTQQNQWRLVCDLEDADITSSSDSMGQVAIDLLPLRNHKLQRKWHTVQRKPAPDPDDDAKLKKSKMSYLWDTGDDDDDDGEVSGEVEVLLRWLYEPERDTWQPFQDLDEAPKLYNELRIGLFRARNLPAMDDDTSDPTMSFSIVPNGRVVDESGKPFKSKPHVSETKYKTLCPVWKQIINIRGGPWGTARKPSQFTLKISCMDHDLFSASDAMGTCDVPLEDLVGGKVLGKWFPLELPGAQQEEQAEVFLFLQLAYNDQPEKKRVRPLACFACTGLFGAPPAAETFDGRDLAPVVTEQQLTMTPATVRQAQSNALVLRDNLRADHAMFHNLVDTCRNFLGDPTNKARCLALAEGLRTAVEANRANAAAKSLRICRANLNRFACRVALRLPSGFFASDRRRPPLLSLSAWRRGFFVKARPIGAPDSAENNDGKDNNGSDIKQEDVKPSFTKTKKASFSATSEFMDGLQSIVAEIVNVTELCVVLVFSLTCCTGTTICRA